MDLAVELQSLPEMAKHKGNRAKIARPKFDTDTAYKEARRGFVAQMASIVTEIQGNERPSEQASERQHDPRQRVLSLAVYVRLDASAGLSAQVFKRTVRSSSNACMTPFTLFLLLFGLWSSIHLVHRFYVPAHKARNILPTSLTSRKRKTTTVTVAGPYLRIESTALNSGHDILVQWFSRNRIFRVPATLRVFFDLGIVVSLLGMVCALAVLVWTFVQLARKLVADLVPQSAGVHPYGKREYDSIYAPPPTATPRTTTDIPVQLLVSTSYFSIMPLTHQPRFPGSPFHSHIFLYS